MRLTPVSTSAAAMSASARSIMAPAASLPKRACVAATLSGEAGVDDARPFRAMPAGEGDGLATYPP
ncbi:MAG: hypothetical protein ACLSTO_01690 [Bilophila wadsworthia]